MKSSRSPNRCASPKSPNRCQSKDVGNLPLGSLAGILSKTPEGEGKREDLELSEVIFLLLWIRKYSEKGRREDPEFSGVIFFFVLTRNYNEQIRGRPRSSWDLFFRTNAAPHGSETRRVLVTTQFSGIIFLLFLTRNYNEQVSLP